MQHVKREIVGRWGNEKGPRKGNCILKKDGKRNFMLLSGTS
jgi:hypothetical protein